MDAIALERAIWKEQAIIDELRREQNKCGPKEIDRWFDLGSAIYARRRRIWALDEQSKAK